MERVLGAEELDIRDESDVVIVRRRVRDLAELHGFDVFGAAALTTATSELARNVLVHGGGGCASLEVVERAGRRGVRIRFSDEGPGIANVELALSGGFSTGRSLGLGLSGSRRLVDEFELHTEVGGGTTVQVAKWTRLIRRP